MTEQQTLEALQKTPLFAGVSAADLRPVAARSRMRLYAAGERIPANNDVWVVVSGLVRSGGDGFKNPLCWLSTPGQTFGCLDFLCRHKHDDEAVAVQASEVVTISRAALEGLVARRPAALKGFVHALAEQLREERRQRALLHLPAAERMLGAVLALYRRIGPRIPLTRAEIADLTAVARETSIRALSPFEKKGLLRTRRGVIEVLKPAELQKAFDRRVATH